MENVLFPPSPTPMHLLLPRPALRALLLAVLFTTHGAHAAPAGAPAPSVRVLDGWRYRWGEPPTAAGARPARAAETGEGPGWAPAEALHTPPGRDEARLLWLSLPVPEGPWDRPALLLGSVSNVLEVYAGGERIYASGTLDPAGYEAIETSAWHIVPLPRSALGGRVLLRVQSSGKAIGVREDARVGELDALRVEALRGAMDVFLTGVLLLVLSLGALSLFVLRGRQHQVGSLAVFSGGTGLLLALMSGVPQALWGAGRGAYLLMLAGAYFAVPGVCAFVDAAVLGARAPWRRRAALALYAFAAACTLATVFVPGALPRVFPVFLLVSVSSVVVCAGLSAAEARQGNPDARLFVAGLCALLLTTTLAALTSLGVLESVGFFMHWGMLALAAALLGILARRALQVVRELHAYAASLSAQQQKVNRLAERLGTGADELAGAVGRLRAASAKQGAGIERQAVALEQAESTVAEIRQTSEVTAENAMMLAASAAEADEAGKEGLAALDRTLTGLRHIHQEVSEMARRIHALEDRTQEISSIVETVKELADQSNLLALNAAIEAQRSGEHGRGFVVVAREVRNLANQSIAATARIRDILEGVGASMREAAGASARGEERVRQSVTELQASGDSLHRLAVLVGETGASVRQMTGAVSQQDTGIRMISSAIGELSDQMRRTLAALHDTEAVTLSVERLAQSMSATASGGGDDTPAAAPATEPLVRGRAA